MTDTLNRETAPVAKLSDECIEQLVIDALAAVKSPELDKAMTYTRWKDGIDIEIPTVDAKEFARALIAASQTDKPQAAQEQVSAFIKTWPERIWLQYDPDEISDFPGCHEGITWCDLKTERGDVGYVRADLAAAPSAPAQQAQQTDTVPMCESCDDPAMIYADGSTGPCQQCVDFLEDAAPAAQQVARNDIPVPVKPSKEMDRIWRELTDQFTISHAAFYAAADAILTYAAAQQVSPDRKDAGQDERAVEADKTKAR